jgi:ABC-type antimicrobial peptide transport system permease subunit
MDDVMTVEQVIQRETWFYTVFGTLFLVFGCSGLLLASVGLYGVMSFAVAQRTRELGIRSALGAPAGGLVLLVMRRSLIQLVLGLVAGVGIGLIATGPLELLLYRVSPRDPFIIALVLLTLTVTGVMASLIPAWRVTRIDPSMALAAE